MPDDTLERDLVGIGNACEADNGKGNGSLCLFRVVEGLDPASWRSLCGELGLTGWHSAPPAELQRSVGRVSLNAAELQLLDFLSREMERARLCQQPVALALIEPESAQAIASLFELAVAQVRSFDMAATLPDARVALVLSGTPLASAERLVGAMLRRIRQVMDSAFVCSAGLVGYGGLVQFAPQELVARAGLALMDARRLGGNRLEVAGSVDAAQASRETLVRASEKHFLFTGKRMPEE